MSQIITRQVLIVNKLGLHARAAAKLVSLASSFESEVLVRKEERAVNAKSIMGVMMLAAGKGVTLELQADGRDADVALNQLEELIRNRFGEPE